MFGIGEVPDVSDRRPSPRPAGGSAPRPFLKRGEGVQKRVFGPQIRKDRKSQHADEGDAPPIKARAPRHAVLKPDVSSVPDQGKHQNSKHVAEEEPQHDEASSYEDYEDMQGELPAQSTYQLLSPGFKASPRPTWLNSPEARPSGHHPTKTAPEDDMELAEFEALEVQIRKDLGHPPPTSHHPGAGNPAHHQRFTEIELGSRPSQTPPWDTAHKPAVGGRAAGGYSDRSLPSWSSIEDQADQQLPGNSGKYSNGAAKTAAVVDQHAKQGAHQPTSLLQQQFGLPNAYGFDDDTEQWDDDQAAAGAAAAASVKRPANTTHHHNQQLQQQQQWQASYAHNTAWEHSGAAGQGGGGAWGGQPLPGDATGGMRTVYDEPDPDPWAPTQPAGDECQEQDWNSQAARGHSRPAADQATSNSSPALTQPFVRSLFPGAAAKQERSASGGGPGGHAAQGGAQGGSRGSGRREAESQPVAAEMQERLQQLEQENAKLQQERSALARLRTDLEHAANKLETERQAWEKKQAVETSRFDQWRQAEVARLERDKRVLDKQSKALLKLPTRKERSAVEAVEAVLEEERRQGRATAARHKLSLERLRQQLLEQQEKNRELREEVRWHEAQRLEHGWGSKDGSKPRSSGGASQQQGTGRPAVQQSHVAVQVDIGSNSFATAVLQDTVEQLMPYMDDTARTAHRSGGGCSDEGSEVEGAGAHRSSRRQPATSGGSKVSKVSAASHVQQPQAAAGRSTGSAARTRPSTSHNSDAATTSARQGRQEQKDVHGHVSRTIAGAYGTTSMQPGSMGNAPTRPEVDAVNKPGAQVTRQAAPSYRGGAVVDASTTQGPSNVSADVSQSHQWYRSDALPPHHTQPSSSHVSDRRQQQAVQGGGVQGSVGESYLGRHMQQHQAPGGVSGSRDQGWTQGDADADALHQLGSTLKLLRVEREQQQVVSNTNQYQQYQQPRDQQQQQRQTQASHQHQAHSNGKAGQYPHDQKQYKHHQQEEEEEEADLESEASFSTSTHQHRPTTSTSQRPDTAARHSSRSHSNGQVLPSQTTSHAAAQRSNSAARPASPPAGGGVGRGTSQASGPRKWSAAPVGSYEEADEVVVQLAQADGRRELQYRSGKREVHYSNGAVKVELPDGQQHIRYANQDLKLALPDGRVHYYYHEVNTWQSSHPDGVEVHYFSTGQVEARYPDGFLEVLFPDGGGRMVWPNSEEQEVRTELLSRYVRQPQPSSMLMCAPTPAPTHPPARRLTQQQPQQQQQQPDIRSVYARAY